MRTRGILVLATVVSVPAIWQLETSVQSSFSSSLSEMIRSERWLALRVDQSQDVWLPSTATGLRSDPTTTMTNTTFHHDNGDNETFSACLLVKEDEHWLIEWLAYHYFVLPLGKLVLLVDPSSRTSPQQVIERWKDLIDIDVWMDDVFPDWVARRKQKEKWDNVRMHRYRQQFFYAKCMKALKAQKKTWVLLSDTDEFIRPNPFIVSMQNHSSSVVAVPPLSEPGSVLAALRAHERVGEPRHKCMHVPRLQITSKEHTTAFEKTFLPLNASQQMLTTRWRYHNGQEMQASKHLNGKNIVHVGRCESSDLPSKVHNVHYVIPTVCPATTGNRLRHADSWLLINHYLGTLEQYTYRQDPRDGLDRRVRRRDQWSTAGQPGVYADDTTQEWINGFVAHVGLDKATILLNDVGVLQTLPPPTSSSMLPGIVTAI
jgi:hypothetical protein